MYKKVLLNNLVLQKTMLLFFNLSVKCHTFVMCVVLSGVYCLLLK